MRERENRLRWPNGISRGEVERLLLFPQALKRWVQLLRRVPGQEHHVRSHLDAPAERKIGNPNRKGPALRERPLLSESNGECPNVLHVGVLNLASDYFGDRMKGVPVAEQCKHREKPRLQPADTRKVVIRIAHAEFESNAAI